MLEQLELLKVLSQEQQNEVDRFVERQNHHVVDRIESMEKMVDMLKEAGFNQGKNFSCTYEVNKETSERSFGWGDNKFTAEVTFNTISGSVYLKHKRFYNGELKTDVSNVSKTGDKLEIEVLRKDKKGNESIKVLKAKVKPVKVAETDEIDLNEKATEQQIITRKTWLGIN